MNVFIPKTFNQVLCIADIKTSMVFRNVDFSELKTSDFFRCHATEDSAFSHKQVNPDAIAMRFYILDLYMFEVAKARGEYWGTLAGSWAYNLSRHRDFLVEECFRSLHYLIAICIREARHVKGMEDPKGLLRSALVSDEATLQSTLPKVDRLNDLHIALKETGFFTKDGTAATNYVLREFPKGFTLLETLEYIHILFEEAGWDSSYGGSAWATLTKAALEVVTGGRSLYEGLDNTFSLVHNNGTIFNKGFFYKNPSDDHLGMKFLLDCQRSGQLVNAALEGYLINPIMQSHSSSPNFSTTKCDTVKGIKIRDQKEGLYPYILELAELNPEYKKPFSFTKLVEDGALGEYPTELKAELNAKSNSVESLQAHTEYFGNKQHNSFVHTKSALIFTPDEKSTNQDPAYTDTPLSLFLGKTGIDDIGSFDSNVYAAFTPFKLLKRVT